MHGPHHGAQKSTITGCSNEPSTTSAMKFAVVTSLTGAAPAAAAADQRFTRHSVSSPGIASQNMAAGPLRMTSARGSRAVRGVTGCGACRRGRGRRDRRCAARCPQAAMKRSRSAGATAVVRSLIERMVVERVVLEHRPRRAPTVTRCAASLTRANGRDAARPHARAPRRGASALPKEKRGAPSRSASQLQVDAALLEHDREPQAALLVLEEEALAVAARQAAAQRRRLGDGEDRRVRVGPVRDAERVEPGEQLFGGQRRGDRHRRRTMRRRAALQAQALQAPSARLGMHAACALMIWIGRMRA